LPPEGKTPRKPAHIAGDENRWPLRSRGGRPFLRKKRIKKKKGAPRFRKKLNSGVLNGKDFKESDSGEGVTTQPARRGCGRVCLRRYPWGKSSKPKKKAFQGSIFQRDGKKREISGGLRGLGGIASPKETEGKMSLRGTRIFARQ